jgi:hypothetical protein
VLDRHPKSWVFPPTLERLVRGSRRIRRRSDPNTTNAGQKALRCRYLPSHHRRRYALPRHHRPWPRRRAGLCLAWGGWCNVSGAGFGVRPTSDTGDYLEDAFVWVKPGGESDGTSDPTAARYDPFCGLADAFKPSPQAGQWNEAYFEMLLKNSIPAFT